MTTYQFARDPGDPSKAVQDPLEALGCAEGTLLCQFDGARLVKSIDATPLLLAFSRRCALGVVHLWYAPDIVRRYLETGDESLVEQAMKLATKFKAPDYETGFAGLFAARSVWDACRAAGGGRAPRAHNEVAWAAFRAAWDSAEAVGVNIEARRAALKELGPAFKELVDAALADAA